MFPTTPFIVRERPGDVWIGPRWPTLTPARRGLERKALTYVLFGTMLLVAAEALSAILDLGSSLGLWTFQLSASGVQLGVTFTFYLLAIASCLVEMVGVVFVWTAFRALATLDPQFSTPAKLPVLLVVGLGLLAIILQPLLSQLSSAVACFRAPGGGSLSTCIPAGLGDLVALGIVIALLAVTGFAGLQLGFWRLGTRYDNGLLPTGAVLSCIPILSVAGAILLSIGARSVRAGHIT